MKKNNKKDSGNTRHLLKKLVSPKLWRKITSVLLAVTVFLTTYMMILPALTIDLDTVVSEPGMDVAVADSKLDMPVYDDSSGLPSTGESQTFMNNELPESAEGALSGSPAYFTEDFLPVSDISAENIDVGYTDETMQGGIDITASEDVDTFLPSEEPEAVPFEDEPTLENETVQNEEIPDLGITEDYTAPEMFDDSLILPEEVGGELTEASDEFPEEEAEVLPADEQESVEDATEPAEFALDSAETAEDATEEREGEENNAEEPSVSSHVLKAEGEDYRVTVSYGDEAEIPEGAELLVTEILSDETGYEQYVNEASEALSTEKRIMSVENARFFDITIIKENEPVEPKAPVTVLVELADNFAAEESAAVIHYTEDEVKVVETVDSEEAAASIEEAEAADEAAAQAAADSEETVIADPVAEMVNDSIESVPLDTPALEENYEGIVEEAISGMGEELFIGSEPAADVEEEPFVGTESIAGMEELPFVGAEPMEVEETDEASVFDEPMNPIAFVTDSFSVYGFVTATLEKTVLASDGHNYKVSVTCGADAGIPEGADLSVEEITQDTPEYDAYVADLENVFGKGEKRIEYVRLFDIKIVDALDDTVKYQPAEGSAVDVRIELADTVNKDLSVVHFGEDEPEGVVLDAGTDEGEEGSVVEFKTDGFSVFAVAYTVDFSYEVNGKTYEFSIPGGGFVRLTDLVEVLGIGTVMDGNDNTAVSGGIEEEPYIPENQDLTEMAEEEEIPVDVGPEESDVGADVFDDVVVSDTADTFNDAVVSDAADTHDDIVGPDAADTIDEAAVSDAVDTLNEAAGSDTVDTFDDSGVSGISDTFNDAASSNAPLTLNDIVVSDASRMFVANVESVEFSNPELVWVDKVEELTTIGGIKSSRGLECEYSAGLTEEQIAEINNSTVEAGDWALISMRPFTSEETLTVTMKNGEVFTICVTDAQIRKTVIDAKGDTWEITVTYGEDAQIPDGAELKVREILPEDEEYDEYCRAASEVALGDAVERGLDGPTVADERLFDIEIHFRERKIEPAAPVRVDIRLTGDSADLLSVVHFAEEGPEAMTLRHQNINTSEETAIVDKRADVGENTAVNEEGAAAGEEGSTQVVSEVSFETDAFSVYDVVKVNSDGELATILANGPFALVTGIAGDPGATTGYQENWGRDYFTIIVNANAMSDTPVKSGNDNIAFMAEGVHAWTDGTNSYVGGEVPQVWEFEPVPNSNRYYIKKAGTNQYIDHHYGNRETCSLSTQYKTDFTVTRNSDGTISISHNGWYLCNNGNGEWGSRDFRLQQNVAGQDRAKFRLCKASDEFDSFSARKVSVQNLSPSDNFIIYRKFVDEDGSEQLYALASDGTFVRVYDGGDTVYWRETNKNIYWNYLPTGTYYGIFSRDPSTNELVYLNPMDSTGQMITGSASSLTLIGKEDGKYGTAIENWDQKAYDYAGLHVTLDNDGVPHLSTGTRAAKTSDEFLFAVAGTMPGSEPETVETVDSEALGIHITMYDYGDWTKEYAAGDKVGEMSDVVANNRDTAEAYTPHQAHQLVKPYLESNVPSSTTKGAMTALFPSQDVAYSNSYSANSKVTEYAKTGVTNLFLKSYYEENGMFRYRSEDNFAYLGNNGETSFKVYRQAATPYTTDKQPGHTYYYHGHYMPFNDIDMDQHVGRLMNQYGNEYTNGNIVGELPIGDGRTYDNIYGTTGIPNFFTGMKMEATFTQPEKGVLENGDDMIFRFTGDDDMWVYIDGVLVLDVGGIHEPLTGTINFRTGEVTNPSGSSLAGTKTLYQIFMDVLNNSSTPQSVKDKINTIEWKDVNNDGTPDTFADYTNHDFKSFYMERGAGASNLDLQFNLKVTLTDQFTVKKELPEGIDPRFVNQTYRFRATFKDNDEDKPLYKGATRVRSGQTEVVCTKVYYKGFVDETTGRPLEPEVEVDEDGYFTLRPGEEVVFKMSDKKIEYSVSEVGIDTNLVEKVEVNGQVVTVEEGTAAAAYASVEDRTHMNYRNHPVLQDLNIIKHILPEMTDEDKTSQFEFRVYLESMVDVDGEQVQQLVPYSYGPYYVTKMVGGVKHYYTLTDENNAPKDCGTEPVVCSTTGRSGSINSIPPEFTVEIRNLAVGTHFYVEERRDNIPAGYAYDHENLREGTYDEATISEIDRIIARDETDHQVFDPQTVGKLKKEGGPAVSDIYNRRIRTFVEKQWRDTTGKVYETPEEIAALPNANNAVITAELWKKNAVETETEDEAVTVTFMVNTTEDSLYRVIGDPLVIRKGSALEFSLGARDTSKADEISASTGAEILRSNATSNPAIEYTNGRKKEKWNKYTLSGVDGDTTVYATFDASKVGDDFVGRYIALCEEPGAGVQIIDRKVSDITLNVGNEWHVSLPQEEGYTYYLKNVTESGLPDNGTYVFNNDPAIVTDEDGNITITLVNIFREPTQVTVQKTWNPELPVGEVDNAYVKVELHRYVKKSKGVMDVTLKDDLYGMPIAGAVLMLQKLGEDGESFEDIETVTTDANGVAGVSELNPGTYRFVQQSTPEGFSMNGHTTTTGTFKVEDNTTEKQEEHFELTNTALRTAGVVTLTVTDNHGDPVEGAAFTLYDSTGRALETGRLSEADGKIVAGPLDAGTYYFEQTGTPEDYKMPGNIRTDSFTVIDHPGDPQLFNLSMSNMLKGKGTVTVTLTKEDTGDPIAGATFELKQGDSVVATAVTDTNGVAAFNNVYEGSYNVHQVNTDDAYKLGTDDWPVTIQDNGEANQTVDLAVSNVAVGKGTVTVTLKTNDTSSPISGARFVLLQGGSLVQEGYTNDNGLVTFENVLEGEYIVQQTSLGNTGNDYKIVENEYDVTIYANGDAHQIVNKDAVNYVKGKGTVTVTLIKKDTDVPISGASFQLKQGDSIIHTGETDDSGVVVFNNVYEGGYAVHQVNTMEGYVVDTEDRNITIQGDGTTNQEVSILFENNEDSRTYRIYIHGTGKNWNGSDYTNKWYKYYTSGTTVTMTIDLENLAWITLEEHTVILNGVNVGRFRFNSPFIYTFTVNNDIEIELGKVTDNNASNIWSKVRFSPDSNSSEEEYTASNNKQSAFSLMSVPYRQFTTTPLSVENVGDRIEYNTDTDENIVFQTAGGLGIDNGPNLDTSAETSVNNTSGTSSGGSGSGSNATVLKSGEAPPDYMDDSAFKEEYTIRKSDNWSHEFENLDKYDESGNLYYYYVVEKECYPENYHLDSFETNDGVITVKNERDKGSLKIQKTGTVGGNTPTEANSGLIDGSYSFTVAGVPNTATADTSVQFSITLKNGVAIAVAPVDLGNGITCGVAEGIVTIGNMPTGRYTVTENLTEKQQNDGISLLGTNGALLEVTTDAANIPTAVLVNDRALGSLQVTKEINTIIGETGGTDSSFPPTGTHTYPVTISTEIDGTTYYVQDANGTLAETQPTTSLTVTAGSGAGTAGPPLVINNLPYGTYTVTEINPGAVVMTGYSFIAADEESHIASITSGNGTITASNTSAVVALKNLYMNGASWEPEVDKLLNGKPYTAGADGYAGYTFLLTEPNGQDTLRAGNGLQAHIRTATTDETGKAVFDRVEYLSSDLSGNEGTFYYTIAESRPEGAQNEPYIADGIQYDTKVIYAKVVVTKSSNSLTAVSTYFSDADCTAPLEGESSFDNTEVGELTVTKTVTGGYTATDSDEFPFTIMRGEKYVTATADGTTYMYSGLSETDPKYTVKAGEANKLTFKNLPAGTYVVTEGSVSETGYEIITTYQVNGTTVETATVQVERNQSENVVINNEYQYLSADLTILKVDANGMTTPLKGAIFTIRPIDETSSSLSEIGESITGQTTGTDNIETGEDGKAEFTELANGYYIVKETKTPAGYIQIDEGYFFIRIVAGQVQLIERDGTGWKVRENSDKLIFTAADEDESLPATIKVGNTRGAALPNTGGSGTTVLYLLGIMLTAFAGVGQLMRKRKY